jgi:hypothetical protein
MSGLAAAGRGQILVWALLLAGALFLGVRSARTVGQVLKDGSAIVQPRQASTNWTGEKASQALARLDRLALAIPSARDPFREAPRHITTRIPRAAPAPVPPLEPVLRALLYDNMKPAVQISLGKSVSGWLAQGEKFSGWTVVEVKPGSVVVANGLRRTELRLN